MSWAHSLPGSTSAATATATAAATTHRLSLNLQIVRNVLRLRISHLNVPFGRADIHSLETRQILFGERWASRRCANEERRAIGVDCLRRYTRCGKKGFRPRLFRRRYPIHVNGRVIRGLANHIYGGSPKFEEGEGEDVGNTNIMSATQTLIRASVQGIVYLIDSVQGHAYTYNPENPVFVGHLEKIPEEDKHTISKTNGCMANVRVRFRDDIREVMATLEQGL